MDVNRLPSGHCPQWEQENRSVAGGGNAFRVDWFQVADREKWKDVGEGRAQTWNTEDIKKF